MFLAGDVMTGRGVDQILPHPGAPNIYEGHARSALDYVELAARANGAIDRPVDFAYVWGAALDALDRVQPDVRIVNLETAVTTSEDAWPGKGIHYRMHPANVPCLKAAGIDCCVLANNHVLDWGREGLVETLDVLRRQGMRTAGAGRNDHDAAAPAVLEGAHGTRVLVFAFCLRDSGVPTDWRATTGRPGVNLASRSLEEIVQALAGQVGAHRRVGDVVVASVHWGGNWGYGVEPEHSSLAHRLIDEARVDIVHGHSSHHAKGIELHRGKLIVYGCGDLLNDYEGIGGYESYRADLALLYLPTVDRASGRLLRLKLVPLRMRRFRLEPVSRGDADWMLAVLNREGRKLGTAFARDEAGDLVLV